MLCSPASPKQGRCSITSELASNSAMLAPPTLCRFAVPMDGPRACFPVRFLHRTLWMTGHVEQVHWLWFSYRFSFPFLSKQVYTYGDQTIHWSIQRHQVGMATVYICVELVHCRVPAQIWFSVKPALDRTATLVAVEKAGFDSCIPWRVVLDRTVNMFCLFKSGEVTARRKALVYFN